MAREVVWFSCGAASAVAAYLSPNATVVYCDTFAEEHPDNRAFLRAVEKWIGRDITIIGSERFVTVSDVFETTRYMSGIKGARCTTEMKKVPRFAFQQPDDIHIFGLTSDEQIRINKMKGNNPELTFSWILRDKGLTKEMCYGVLIAAGIPLPPMYGLGFNNNNCLGCVKATSPTYWNLIRKHFPEIFNRRVKQSRDLKVRLVRWKGKRIFLDELPLDASGGKDIDMDCGVLCDS